MIDNKPGKKPGKATTNDLPSAWIWLCAGDHGIEDPVERFDGCCFQHPHGGSIILSAVSETLIPCTGAAAVVGVPGRCGGASRLRLSFGRKLGDSPGTPADDRQPTWTRAVGDDGRNKPLWRRLPVWLTIGLTTA